MTKNENNLYYKKCIIQKMSNDPLHGITLKAILEKLVDFYGFDTLGELINIKFNFLTKNRMGSKKSRRIICKKFEEI
jgi:uncharacterized protein (DUF2132 family)